MGRGRDLAERYDETALLDRVLAARPGNHHSYWIVRYQAAIRQRRIARLLLFIDYASRMARTVELAGGGWYGRHVVWAISRLVDLGYTFPECDPVFRSINIDPPAKRAAA